MMNKTEILKKAEILASGLGTAFIREVHVLLNSGGVGKSTKIGTIFAVALDNLADDYNTKRRQDKEFQNLKRF